MTVRITTGHTRGQGAHDDDPRAGTDRPAGGAEAGTTHPVQALRQEIDRVFEEFVRDFGPPFRWRGFGFGPFGQVETEYRSPGEVMPRAECLETDSEIVITVELPGVQLDDIEVSLADGMLDVQGVKARGEAVGDAKVHLAERRYGSIARSFRVPARVDEDAISASFDNGVLLITLPKRYTDPPAGKRVAVIPR
ncbi:MAG: Hsp20/alpha crystallin family protein [Rhodospirillales bacterium]|nr:MAG: Hsp20/alpha crystallin family protein [Rhodospirillales bacterium]